MLQIHVPKGVGIFLFLSPTHSSLWLDYQLLQFYCYPCVNSRFLELPL